MVATDLATIAQFGFAAVAAWMLLTFIRDLIPKLLLIVQQNSEAMQRMATVMEEVVRGQDKLRAMIGQMDGRLIRLEERHERLARECPFNGAAKPADHFGKGVKADGD